MFTAGCAGPEQKLGRGMSNIYEIVRMGEMRRSVEQNAVLDSPGAGYTTGVIRGFDRSLARTGVGAYRSRHLPAAACTDPVFTSIRSRPEPAFPESYKPGLISESLFDTDTYTGFSGGDVAPFIPGSRFKVFDN